MEVFPDCELVTPFQYFFPLGEVALALQPAFALEERQLGTGILGVTVPPQESWGCPAAWCPSPVMSLRPTLALCPSQALRSVCAEPPLCCSPGMLGLLLQREKARQVKQKPLLRR